MRINETLTISETDLKERFIRASGPGGQKVNKVSTAVELRFDTSACTDLTLAARQRLARLAGRRMTADGVLIIFADRHRTQERNRADARDRLAELIRRALVPPKTRVKTKPSRAAKERRLQAKGRRGLVKRLRRDKTDAGGD